MKIADFVKRLKIHPDFKDSIVYHHYIPPEKPLYVKEDLPEKISSALKEIGIERLFSHQAMALRNIREGRDVVVSTKTSSGKSLIYNIAVFEKILEEPDTRAFYIFPLKALEQDQLKGFYLLSEKISPHIKAKIYDGDTGSYERKKIKELPPNVIFTNPDMLHLSILPYHKSWADFFKKLSFVIIDEIHTYRGIFGSHMSQIIRRLRRICNYYGSDPTFILLSATVSNPKEFVKKLIQKDVVVIDRDGSPSSGRHFLILDPEISQNVFAARLLVECIKKGFRTIVFTQSRKTAELIYIWAGQFAPDLKEKISSYRAGFLPEERRKIERSLAKGELFGVISTSALEMGIDIGYLDVCILVGYPGTIINLWQRSGRVGRSGKEALVILISGKDALDQYFIKHPKELFERPFESAILDPENPYIVEKHLICAAAELPLDDKDIRYWKDLFFYISSLERKGLLFKDKKGWSSRKRFPHLQINIRSAGQNYEIFEKNTSQIIGTIDEIRAFSECHPGAIYLHRGDQYLIHSIDVEKKRIIAEETEVAYFTRTFTEKEIQIIDEIGSREFERFKVKKARLRVKERVIGYEKRKIKGQELLGIYPLDLPPNVFETKGIWIEIPDEIKEKIEEKRMSFLGGIHAVEHAMIGMFPFFVLCDRNDIGGISYSWHPQLKKSAIFIYDGYPGGAGLSEHAFEIIDKLLRKTLELIRGCGCEDGCPSCIHSPKCGSGNRPLDKKASIEILKMLSEDMKEKKTSRTRITSDPKLIFLDLETQKTAQEVGGWKNAHLMKVSVAVIYDSIEKRYYAFGEDDIEFLIRILEKGDLIIGFNIKRFDYRVLSAYTEEKRIFELPTFDILDDVYRRIGFRLSLDHLARNTLNKGKIGNGLLAVKWFKEGDMESLIKYCMRDVEVTKDLFYYGLEKGYLVYSRKGKKIKIPVDWKLEEMLKR